jgi:hypothetical protein
MAISATTEIIVVNVEFSVDTPAGDVVVPMFVLLRADNSRHLLACSVSIVG